MKKILLFFMAAAALISCQRQSHVVDDAQLFQRPDAIDNTITALEHDHDVVAVVATIPSLGGKDIAATAQEMFNEWGIGDKETNNGVLILIVPKTPAQDGQVRIQTGLGTEQWLTDDQCREIIDNVMLPRLKSNDYDGAVVEAIRAIADKCGKSADKQAA